MVDRPILIFPEPARVSKHRRIGPNIPGPHRPTVETQSQRLGPKFDRLQAAFDPERLSIQGRPDGLEPEKALVMEIEGSIKDFQNAVGRISGLEWLADWSRDDLEPDEIFYFSSEDGEPKDQSIPARLYVTMADRRGAEELLSLWRRFVETDGEATFARGLNKFRELFRRLHDLRFWDAQDRIEETGLREIWEERLEAGDETIRPEIELWHRQTVGRREEAERWVTRLVHEAGGRVLSRCQIPEIQYHGILAEMPISAFDSIFERTDAALIRCDDIMFMRPRGQVVAEPLDDRDDLPQPEGRPSGAGVLAREPRVALLDGLPLENHILLRDRLLIDDPDDWAADYPAVTRSHGTVMASLIVHGDLEEQGPALRRPVYVRPVMKPRDSSSGPREEMPGEILALDLIHRAVRRIFEGDGDEPPAAPTVILICLSLGDSARPFLRTMSPWARLIDYLSHRYRALFLISAGNHPSLELESTDGLENLAPSERESRVLRAMRSRMRHRRLLAPAESINGLTIGALHGDASEVGPLGLAFDPMPSDAALPAFYSALGAGFRRSIKPDLMLPGGRQPARRDYRMGSARIQATQSTRPPGQKAAHPPRPAQRALDATAYTRGTSNASALASRAGALLLEELEETLNPLSLELDKLAVITKALLVHGSSQGMLPEILKSRLAENGMNRREVSRFLGYGLLDLPRVLRCTEQRATLLGLGDLSKDQAHRFRVPLPPSLASRREWRRLTVTLAWLSPINAIHQQYRRAALWFQPFGDQEFETRVNSRGYEHSVPVSPVVDFDALSRLALTRREVDYQQVQNGTVQHEIFDGESAVAFIDGEEAHIQVNCRADAGRLNEPIPYALAVTLEVAEGIDIPVYQEVRDRIRVPVAP